MEGAGVKTYNGYKKLKMIIPSIFYSTQNLKIMKLIISLTCEKFIQNVGVL